MRNKHKKYKGSLDNKNIKKYNGSLLYQKMKEQNELNIDTSFPKYSIVKNSYIWVPSLAIIPLLELGLMPPWYLSSYTLTALGIMLWMFFGKTPKDKDTAVFYLKLLTLVFVVILILYLIYKLGMFVLHMQGFA